MISVLVMRLHHRKQGWHVPAAHFPMGTAMQVVPPTCQAWCSANGVCIRRPAVFARIFVSHRSRARHAPLDALRTVIVPHPGDRAMLIAPACSRRHHQRCILYQIGLDLVDPEAVRPPRHRDRCLPGCRQRLDCYRPAPFLNVIFIHMAMPAFQLPIIVCHGCCIATSAPCRASRSPGRSGDDRRFAASARLPPAEWLQ